SPSDERCSRSWRMSRLVPSAITSKMSVMWIRVVVPRAEYHDEGSARGDRRTLDAPKGGADVRYLFGDLSTAARRSARVAHRTPHGLLLSFTPGAADLRLAGAGVHGAALTAHRLGRPHGHATCRRAVH